MKNPIWIGVLRHVLTAGGGALVAGGTLTGDELEAAVSGVVTIVGAAMTLAGIVASVREKLARRRAAPAA